MTKLLLDQDELSITGRYSVRIDKTIVIEPLRHLTEDTFRNLLRSKAIVKRIGIRRQEDESFLTFDGPYSFRRVNGILIFQRTAI
ncbi:hypothetical protein QRD89_14575 [Halobacillus sp. ACCC02827]|uniref:hypothetical protein n=1 Tax=Bacillaceae TaxID=186817 RepID=UPI00128FD493|nr:MULTISPECIES: hypothetical protein [Bacillaceae]QHT47692.1 hypothetical protein M662_14780 [Bacillus sp. SB49]WJE14932.1 hypothetical protein QRD89_14575 [Halobacillus sp. ACCC02827]